MLRHLLRRSARGEVLRSRPGGRTAAAATAASIALPPLFNICRPACAANGWLVATIPFRARTSERDCASQPLARSPRAAANSAAWFGGAASMIPSATT
jgi:hypothetical protein